MAVLARSTVPELRVYRCSRASSPVRRSYHSQNDARLFEADVEHAGLRIGRHDWGDSQVAWLRVQFGLQHIASSLRRPPLAPATHQGPDRQPDGLFPKPRVAMGALAQVKDAPGDVCTVMAKTVVLPMPVAGLQ